MPTSGGAPGDAREHAPGSAWCGDAPRAPGDRSGDSSPASSGGASSRPKCSLSDGKPAPAESSVGRASTSAVSPGATHAGAHPPRFASGAHALHVIDERGSGAHRRTGHEPVHAIRMCQLIVVPDGAAGEIGVVDSRRMRERCRDDHAAIGWHRAGGRSSLRSKPSRIVERETGPARRLRDRFVSR